jgi:uncharacterized protein
MELSMNVPENELGKLLLKYKKICIYGLGTDETKPSFTVPSYIRSQGWDVVGVHPKEHSVGGFKTYKSLKDVPEDYRKFVDVFRAPDKIPQVVDEVLEVGGVEVLWLQLGITNPVAEKKAEDAGLKVVSNHCIAIEHKKTRT